MPSDHKQFQARRVVSGVNGDGKSTIVLDENTTTRAVTDGFTVADVWQADTIPASVDAKDTLDGTVALAPPAEGVVVRFASFPPDSEWDAAAGYESALGDLQAGDAYTADDAISGLHVTETIDIVTIVSGELYAVLEDSETRLRPGDTFVQRGTKHTWSNRSDRSATFVATMIPATRD